MTLLNIILNSLLSVLSQNSTILLFFIMHIYTPLSIHLVKWSRMGVKVGQYNTHFKFINCFLPYEVELFPPSESKFR